MNIVSFLKNVLKILTYLKYSFLTIAIVRFGVTFHGFGNGDSLGVVILNAFLTTICFLVFIYLDLKKELK